MKYVGHGIWVNEEEVKKWLAEDVIFVRKYIKEEIKKGNVKPIKLLPAPQTENK